MKKISLLFGIFALPVLLFGQSLNKENIGLEFAQNHLSELGVSGEDIHEMIITDRYTSNHNGVTHIYYVQAHNGIPVHNAMFNVNISKNNEVFHYGNRMYSGLKSRIKGEVPQINPADALGVQLKEVGMGNKEIPALLKKDSDYSFVFDVADYSEGNITVDLKYYPEGDDLVLAYEVKLLEKENPNYWHTVVNAITGEIINHDDATLYCSFHKEAFHNHDRGCFEAPKSLNEAPEEAGVAGTYRVYPLPAESPIHGTHDLITDPHDPMASPYGWHDVDGMDGAEFTITRGNNVHAYRDANDTGVSSGDEPDGGVDLVFDFPHFQMEEPDSSIAADITNLFYMNNMMHDIAYRFGFDEEAGNFQSNNYGKGGQQGDYVNAQGQDGANLLDGDHLNNANFATPSDGNSGRMQMYYWSITQSSTFITEPAELAGGLEVVVPSATDWGFIYSTQFAQLDITAPVVVVDDGGGNGASRGCNPLVNGDELNGNIALIDRGICEFGTKSLNAQNAGAVAALICNVPGVNGGDGEEGVSMSGGTDGLNVTIPALFMKYSDCLRIKASINAGVPVIININERDEGIPDYYSSSFDNGVVAHEYGHGISTRLTGGPNTSGCLGNGEQMGEGWSDFFSLITSVEQGDAGGDRRGIGNYVDGTTVNGRGIRRFPYSTDMSVNPQTLTDIYGQGVHGTGEIWAGVLWDLYWAFVDVYGYDADLTNTESGNFKAVQLVFDGMKFQPCGPGFIDGRDAILVADEANYNGENKCLIWEVFARRGMGFYADQNDPDSNTDNVEDFEPLPTCIKELKIRKSISNVFVPGEETEIVLSFANHTDVMETNVRITDDLPENTIFVSHDSEYDFEIVGNTIVFDIGDMPSVTEDTIRYIVQPDPTVSSAILYTDNNEDPDATDVNWSRDIIEGFNIWQLNGLEQFSYSGFSSWYIAEGFDDTTSDLIYNSLSVTGDNPVLRIWHRYNLLLNGGYIEVSADGQNWDRVQDKFIRNGYPAELQYTIFAIPALDGFSGNSDGFVDSYIDLTAYKGEDIMIRFRFGTYEPTDEVQAATNFAPDNAWFVDDIDLIDLITYDTEACITGDTESGCSGVKETIIDASLGTSSEEIALNGFDWNIYPNPAQDFVTLTIESDNGFNAEVAMFSLEGKMLTSKAVQINGKREMMVLNTSNLNEGMYIVQLNTGSQVFTKKVMIH